MNADVFITLALPLLTFTVPVFASLVMALVGGDAKGHSPVAPVPDDDSLTNDRAVALARLDVDDLARLDGVGAANLAILMLYWRDWVHRRTETVVFIDDVHIRRRHTVDFSIPRQAVNDGRVLLPLALLAKRPLRNFDLRGAGGEALSMLTLRENTDVAEQILTATATSALDDPDLQADKHLMGLVQRLVGPDKWEEASSEIEEVKGPVDPDRLGVLKGNAWFAPLAAELAPNFALLVPFWPGTESRCIAKFAYDERPERHRPPNPGRTRLGRLLRRARKGFLRWAALEPVKIEILATALSMAESYHIEIQAPDDLVIERAELLKGQSQEEEKSGRPAEPLCAPVIAIDRAHLSTREQARGTVGKLVVTFRVRSSRVLSAARTISVVTSVIIWAGLVLHWLRVPAHSAVAALLIVILPGIFATYLVRPDEHQLVQRLSRGVRVMIASQAAVSFIAAGSLSVGLDTYWRVVTWLICAIASTLGSVITWEGNRRSSVVERKVRSPDLS